MKLWPVALLTLFQFVGCTTIPQGVQAITDEFTLNAIALCSGGYGASYAAALRTRWIERNGELVLGGELGQIQQGQNPFIISDLSGLDAVEMYNTYTECIRQRGESSGGLDTQDNDVSYSCYDAWYTLRSAQRGFNYGSEYVCLVKNNSNTQRNCKLLSTWVVKSRSTDNILGRHGIEVLDFSLRSGSVDDKSGLVGCRILDLETQSADIEQIRARCNTCTELQCTHIKLLRSPSVLRQRSRLLCTISQFWYDCSEINTSSAA